MHQNAQICTLQFKNFPGAMPRTPTLRRGYGASLNASPLGTPALLASSVSIGTSLVPQCFLAVDATAHHQSITYLLTWSHLTSNWQWYSFLWCCHTCSSICRLFPKISLFSACLASSSIFISWTSSTSLCLPQPILLVSTFSIHHSSLFHSKLKTYLSGKSFPPPISYHRHLWLLG